MVKNDDNRVRLVMYTQQVKYMHDGEHMAKPFADVSSAESVANEIAKRLRSLGTKYVASVKHDKDVLPVWDERLGEDVMEAKAEHYHTVIKFDDRVDFDAVVEAIGDAPQNIEKAKKGRYAEENMLAYLVHAKDSSKHLYSPDEVATVGAIGTVKEGTGADGSYQRYWAENKTKWDAQRAKRTVEQSRMGVERLRELVLDFKVSRRQMFMKDELFEVYKSAPDLIDRAFNTRIEKAFYETEAKYSRGEMVLTTIYIHGPSGSGKTRLAKTLTQKLEANGEQVYTAASSNPLDDYTGESTVLIDDVKLNTMTPDEWLKLLDPILFAPLSGRYRNKKRAMRTIIITGILPPDEFFARLVTHTKNYNMEPLEQFIRRLQYVCKIIEVDEYELSRLAVGDGEYEHVPVAKLVGQTDAVETLGTIVSRNGQPDPERVGWTVSVNDVQAEFDRETAERG